MCCDRIICMDSVAFDEIISEIHKTRTQLMTSLEESEKSLKKLDALRSKSFKGNIFRRTERNQE